jgi:hypothetical protein
MTKLGPLPDVAGVVKIRLLGTSQGGSKWANIMHAKVTGTIDTTGLNTAATAIGGYWLTRFGLLVGMNTTLTTVELTDLTTRSAAQGSSTVGWQGSGAGQLAPASVAACLTLKVPNRYRGGHPRMYVPSVLLSNIANGTVWASGAAAAYQAAGRGFRTDINAIIVGGTTWQLCAVSYYKSVNGQPLYKTPPEVYIVSDVIVHSRIDSMRRRTGKEVS